VVSSASQNQFSVSVDNNQYQSSGNNNTINIGPLYSGNHNIVIYEWKKNFWGKQVQKTVYNSSLNLKQGFETSVFLNSNGQVNISERQLYNSNNNTKDGYGNNGNGVGYGYGRDKNKHKKKHKHYDDDDRNYRKGDRDWDDRDLNCSKHPYPYKKIPWLNRGIFCKYKLAFTSLMLLALLFQYQQDWQLHECHIAP
jgi:hypothetical protein